MSWKICCLCCQYLGLLSLGGGETGTSGMWLGQEHVGLVVAWRVDCRLPGLAGPGICLILLEGCQRVYIGCCCAYV